MVILALSRIDGLTCVDRADSIQSLVNGRVDSCIGSSVDGFSSRINGVGWVVVLDILLSWLHCYGC